MRELTSWFTWCSPKDRAYPTSLKVYNYVGKAWIKLNKIKNATTETKALEGEERAREERRALKGEERAREERRILKGGGKAREERREEKRRRKREKKRGRER